MFECIGEGGGVDYRDVKLGHPRFFFEAFDEGDEILEAGVPVHTDEDEDHKVDHAHQSSSNSPKLQHKRHIPKCF